VIVNPSTPDAGSSSATDTGNTSPDAGAGSSSDSGSSGTSGQ
jgi:hypothetical protein